MKIFLALLFLIVSIPILIPIVTLIVISRQMVKILAKIFRPDLAEMVTCLGNATANLDSKHIEKPRFAVLGKLTYSGKIPIEKLIERSISQVFYLKNSNGELKYPEIQQYLTSWFGFRFWTQEKDFKFENHAEIVNLGKEIVTQDDLREFGEKLLVKPFDPKRSPWDIHLVHNVQSNNSVRFPVIP